MANNKYTDIQKNIIYNNYISNGIDHCVTLTGLSRKQVAYLAYIIGIKMSSDCRKTQINKKRINDTYNATLEIATPETAYLLGILWGMDI